MGIILKTLIRIIRRLKESEWVYISTIKKRIEADIFDSNELLIRDTHASTRGHIRLRSPITRTTWRFNKFPEEQ